MALADSFQPLASASLVGNNPRSQRRKLIVWAVTAFLLGSGLALTSGTVLTLAITPETGYSACIVTIVLVAMLSGTPFGRRIAVIANGLMFALPAFVTGSGFFRCLLACCMALPFVGAVEMLFEPVAGGFPARLGHLCAFCTSRRAKLQRRHFDLSALLTLVIATVVLATAIEAAKLAPRHGSWMLLRWVSGGVIMFAFAEMVTAGVPLFSAALGVKVQQLFQSPYRSASINEFWTKRWNLLASEGFRWCCFNPLRRFGVGVALFVAFGASAVAHLLLAYLGLGNWNLAIACGAFFFVQPIFILMERRFNVRRWPRAAAWGWTMAVLAITCPLFVEPMLRPTEEVWGPPEVLLQPTLAVLGIVLVLSGMLSIGAFVSKRWTPAAK